MKTTIKKRLATITMLLCCITMSAYGSEGYIDFWTRDGISYGLKTDLTIEVCDCDENYRGHITIPSRMTVGLTNYSVTSIRENAFSDCTGLTSVVIPGSVKSIGDDAFSFCTGLTSVTLPENLTSSIGDRAFRYCPGLTSITLPEGLTSIGKEAFSSCDGLTSITIPGSVTSIGSGAFSYCDNLTSINVAVNNPIFDSKGNCLVNTETNILLRGCNNTIIPEGVTAIGNGAFSDCSGLTSITLPEDVTSIGNSAFSGCSGLTSITFPEDLKSIGRHAFWCCSGLTSITLPESVTSIGDGAFYVCSSIHTVINYTSLDMKYSYFCGDVDVWLPRRIINVDGNVGGLLFEKINDQYYLSAYVGNDSELTLPEKYKDKEYAIKDLAFYKCTGLTSITIPASMTSIGYEAFMNCSVRDVINYSNLNIQKLEDGNSNYSHEDGIVSVRATRVIKVDGNVGGLLFEKINDQYYLSRYVGNDSELVLPKKYKDKEYDIKDGAFSCCTNLTSIVIPEGVTSIGEDAFESCEGLTSITLPKSLKSIGEDAFSCCTNLTSIVIPEGVTSIGKGAFAVCEGLTSITLPESLKSIGGYAFYGCRSLTSIILPEGLTSIDEWFFAGCDGLTSITLPEGLTSIGEWAFAGCSMTSLVLPEGLTSIGELAFAECTSLAALTCKHMTPPTCGKDVFIYVNTSDCTLNVPEEAIAMYAATEPWSGFNILGFATSDVVNLTDGQVFENEKEKTVSKVTYTRTLNNTEWNALYLPFEIPVSQLTDKYEVAYINAIHSYDEDDNGEIDRMSMEVIKLREGTLHANHPYLIKARTTAAKQMSITVENTMLYKAESRTLDCSSVYTKFEITGIYEKMTSEQLAGSYALSGGSWKNLTSGSTLNPFRLYLRVSSREGSPVKLSEAALARIGIHVQGEETATSVEERLMQKQHKSDAIYDLSGRRVTHPKKGQTYIVNGKKRMY